VQAARSSPICLQWQRAGPQCCRPARTQRLGEPLELLRWGPCNSGPAACRALVSDRRSPNWTSTAPPLRSPDPQRQPLLLSHPSEELVWALTWAISPLRLLGLRWDRLVFTLLLALRFLPLVQEEIQKPVALAGHPVREPAQPWP